MRRFIRKEQILDQDKSTRAHLITNHSPNNEDKLSLMKEETNTIAHILSPQQLELLFKTNIETGLTEEIANKRLARDGLNELHAIKSISYFNIFCQNFLSWFQCVLWAAATISFVTYAAISSTDDDDNPDYSIKERLYLGLLIIGTAVGTGAFGFYNEAKNIATMSGFEKMIPPNALVIRDGIKKEIPNNTVVIGDIVEMTGGQIVPADVRIIECVDFRTDMASLTGELLPVSHKPDNTHPNPLKSKNMAYFTCPVTEGWAKGIVVEVGEFTQIGKIAGLVTGLQKKQSSLNEEIKYFINIICIVAFILGITFFTMFYIVYKDWLSALTCMLGIILANIPEGLLVTLSVCMTLSANELLKKNCLAKSLQAVETLGSTSCICSDKTGTLTQNKMTVSHLFCNFNLIDKDDHSNVSDPIYTQLCFAACLNLRATFSSNFCVDEPIENRKIFGDISEAAILRYMEVHRSATSVQKINPKVAEIPFSSIFKYQITIHNVQYKDEYYLIMKGAPEIVVEYCSTVMICKDRKKKTVESMEITAKVKNELKDNFSKIANMGERMIGYADFWFPARKYPKGFKFNTQDRNFPVKSLRFIGAISIIDPARFEVSKAIATCRNAGIKVVMVTGDHPVTALAISRKIGTITNPTAFDYAFEHHIDVADVPAHIKKQFLAAIITGEELRQMSAFKLKQTIRTYQELTFARTSPQQKLFIVENYQALNYVVAVTGEGVDDSPALRKAVIGIALGITGTEVSKQTADMILLDDNFASIVLGVKEGRRLFENLKKTIVYTLTSNTPEMLPFVLYAILGVPLPISLILILVINIGTDLVPAISLAYETSESDIMHMPPRKMNDHLVNRQLLFMAYFQVGLMQFCAAMFAYFVVFSEAGFFPPSLFFIRDKWESPTMEVVDSFGRTWFYYNRKAIEKKAQTAYFVAVCLTQISNVIICKTRRVSLLKKGMNNWMLNASIAIDVAAAAVVTYLPFCHEVLGTHPLSCKNFLLAVPFMILMIVVDELRRYLIRNDISHFIKAETYY